MFLSLPHGKKEKQSFYRCLDYFSKEEEGAMLQEFWELDKKVIHQGYQKIVENLEKGKTTGTGTYSQPSLSRIK